MPAIRISTLFGRGRGNANNEARRRDDAVVGAEHGRAEPADALDEVAFRVLPASAHMESLARYFDGVLHHTSPLGASASK